jgi:acyl phosphate:glycerol-3-phosphate acyltransferase
MLLLYLLVIIAAGYLLGSIPFGLLLTRAAGLGDIRKIGSGNIGATNVLRTGNRGLAAATLLGDVLKGTLAVLIGRWLVGEPGALLGATAAFFGHLYPVWLDFKGGKGVATFLGVLTGVFWPAGIAFALIWIGVAWVTRYSSLSAIVASLTAPLILLASTQVWAALLFVLLALLLVWKHAGNIDRLLAGTEPRIGQRGRASPAPPQSEGPPT